MSLSTISLVAGLSAVFGATVTVENEHLRMTVSDAHGDHPNETREYLPGIRRIEHKAMPALDNPVAEGGWGQAETMEANWSSKVSGSAGCCVYGEPDYNFYTCTDCNFSMRLAPCYIVDADDSSVTLWWPLWQPVSDWPAKYAANFFRREGYLPRHALWPIDLRVRYELAGSGIDIVTTAEILGPLPEGTEFLHIFFASYIAQPQETTVQFWEHFQGPLATVGTFGGADRGSLRGAGQPALTYTHPLGARCRLIWEYHGKAYMLPYYWSNAVDGAFLQVITGHESDRLTLMDWWGGEGLPPVLAHDWNHTILNPREGGIYTRRARIVLRPAFTSAIAELGYGLLEYLAFMARAPGNAALN